MLPLPARRYLLHGIAGSPDVIRYLLRDARPEDFDRRPDPERFTLREVVAHLADWEGIWLERLEAMVRDDNPLLQGYDEGQWAIDHDYAHSDLHRELARFRAGRERLTGFLRGLEPEEWARPGVHSEWGPATVASMAMLVLGHDGYHTHQIVQWLTAEA